MHKFGKIKNKYFGEAERRLFSRVTFSQMPCSDFPSAAFIKFKSDDQTFLAFGGVINEIQGRLPA